MIIARYKDFVGNETWAVADTVEQAVASIQYQERLEELPPMDSLKFWEGNELSVIREVTYIVTD